MNGVSAMSGDFRSEMKFWLIHCFVSAVPYLSFALSLESQSELLAGMVARISATALFALACALIGMRFGGFAKSQAVYPRALRVILRLRALQVCLLIPVYVAGIFFKTVAPVAIALLAPDFICGLGAVKMYERLSEDVTVKGGVILEAWHPFLSAFVFMGLFAVVWSVVFCALTLPTMLPLSLRDSKKRHRRIRVFR